MTALEQSEGLRHDRAESERRRVLQRLSVRQQSPEEFRLRAPAEAGDYEVRVLGAQSPYPTLARRAVRFESVAASLEAPERVEAGATFTVRWTGPAYDRDFVAIGDKQHPYIVYAYTRTGNPIALRAPDQAGDYELRYFLGSGEKVIAARRSRHRRRRRYGERAGKSRRGVALRRHVERTEQSA